VNFIWRMQAKPSRRGQGMVEFALVLPLLVLVLLLAIDLGRVFFGWVSITNASRVGANYAAIYPDSWEGTGNAARQATYLTLVTDSITGCTPHPIPDPVFTDGPDTLTPDKTNDVSDDATVSLACDFALITPFISQVVGSTIVIHANSDFPVRTGNYQGPTGVVPAPPPCTGATVPNLTLRTVAAARALWTSLFTGAFTAVPNIDTYIVQPPQTTTPPAAVGACADLNTTVTVTATAPPSCPAGEALVPNLVGLTLTAARTQWASKGFSPARFNPSTGQDTQIVLATPPPLFTPAPVNGCLPTATASVTVTPGTPPVPSCDVPNMVGLSKNAAQAAWALAEFTGALGNVGNGPQVIIQDPGHPGSVPCTRSGTITMGHP
jgi:hypothetical protein